MKSEDVKKNVECRIRCLQRNEFARFPENDVMNLTLSQNQTNLRTPRNANTKTYINAQKV